MSRLTSTPIRAVSATLSSPSTPCPWGELQQQIYDAMLDRYTGVFDLDRRDQAMFAQMGEVTMYLLQAACSPRLLSGNGDPARAYRFPSLAIPAGSRLADLVAMWPPACEFVRRGTSATSLGEPEPVHDILIAAHP
jgi:hypothetical protein